MTFLDELKQAQERDVRRKRASEAVLELLESLGRDDCLLVLADVMNYFSHAHARARERPVGYEPPLSPTAAVLAGLGSPESAGPTGLLRRLLQTAHAPVTPAMVIKEASKLRPEIPKPHLYSAFTKLLDREPELSKYVLRKEATAEDAK